MNSLKSGGCQAESSDGDHLRLVVESRHQGMRFDQFASRMLPDLSRSVIAESIRSGALKVNGLERKCSYRLKTGDVLTGSVPDKPQCLSLNPQKVPFTILHEDSSLLVISKPPGIVVHPGNGNEDGTLVHGLLHHCRTIEGVGDELRPGIVHRLDKDTSGIMLVAKTAAAHRYLVEEFKNRRIEKEYLALVCGRPREDSGRIVAPIGRHPVNRKKMAVRPDDGKPAASNWQLIQFFAQGYSLLRVVIESGRTHQIRVHMAHLGCPVAGDGVYGGGGNREGYDRQMLHAHRLAFVHPSDGERRGFTAPIWSDMAHILDELGWEGREL